MNKERREGRDMVKKRKKKMDKYLLLVVLVATSVSVARGFGSLSRFVAIDAYYIAAFAARPVEVEQSRFADIAHLANSLYNSFPRNLLGRTVAILGFGCQRLGLGFLFCLHHPAKLISDMGQQKDGHVRVQLLNRLFWLR